MAKDVVLTGLRSNAEFHLGNYLGAILPMVDFQKKHAGRYQLNMFIPDLHSFTTPIDHSKLYKQTHENLKVFVAAGLDINHPDTFIYRQSYITAHSELTVILNNFAYFGELSRMTQFKEKAEELKQKSVSAGLFDYPVLMATDILIYGAKYVPVGEDQQQHLEFARDLGLRFNHKFGDIFTIPLPLQEQIKFAKRDQAPRIRSLRNPDKKMAKSVDDPTGTINLSDSPEEAAKKILSATTDSLGSINLDFKNQPGVSNLIQILALLSDKTIDAVAREYKGHTSYGPLKEATAKAVKKMLGDLQSAVEKVNDKQIGDKLEADEAMMTKVANATLLKVQKAVGLRPI